MDNDVQLIGYILTFIGVCLTIILTQWTTSKQLSQIYDQSSDWTKHLVDVMETPTSKLKEEHLLIVKRALRIYQKKDVQSLNIKDSRLIEWMNGLDFLLTEFTFLRRRRYNANVFGRNWDFMCDISHAYLDERLKEFRDSKKEDFILNDDKAENIRLIAQTLFTNRWEYIQLQRKSVLPQRRINKLAPIFIRTTLILIEDDQDILTNYDLPAAYDSELPDIFKNVCIKEEKNSKEKHLNEKLFEEKYQDILTAQKELWH